MRAITRSMTESYVVQVPEQIRIDIQPWEQMLNGEVILGHLLGALTASIHARNLNQSEHHGTAQPIGCRPKWHPELRLTTLIRCRHTIEYSWKGGIRTLNTKVTASRDAISLPTNVYCKRKGWDSNPRWLSPHRVSNPAHSASLPPFHEALGGGRTRDLPFRKRLLYPLSYKGVRL